MDDKIAERLGGKEFGKSTVIYKFQMIKDAKAAALKARSGVSLIDMGVGEPDWPADASVVGRLAEEAGRPENRWYADNGIPEFQEAAARYMDAVYSVKGLQGAENIVHGIGSKPVLAMLPICFLDPGEVILMTVPGYPVSGTYARYLGADVHPVPLLEQNGFLPDLASIPATVLSRAGMLYLNYPNNPTGAVASAEFFRDVVRFAEKHGIVVVHDAAYAALTYDGYKPLSFLSVEGGIEVGLEVHSLSKAFNMTGWRLGFVAGGAKAVKAYATVKDNTDSGQFRAIQKAGIHALQHTEITARTAEKYSRRFDLLVAALRAAGFDAKKPKGSFYIYVRAPKGTRDGRTFASASAFSEFLIREALISTVPWDDAGAYVRFSVTFEAAAPEDEKTVIAEMAVRMQKLGLVF